MYEYNVDKMCTAWIPTGSWHQFQGLHCQRCIIPSSIRHLQATSYLQRPAARGLHSEPPPADPTRHQAPDRLYSLIELELRTHDTAVLDAYTAFVKQAAGHLNVELGQIYDLPRHHERMSLLKSVHIFAKHKVQYEIRTYFRVLELLRLTGSTADTFLEYTQRMLPEGISMKVTRTAREPVPDHLSCRPEQQEQEQDRRIPRVVPDASDAAHPSDADPPRSSVASAAKSGH
ncbi:28S ribosomal protein S10, mitochondrial-like [Pollicipes pollicipes]|uniref:28S ribosomal protein S10, mitochondrial-like n=1 Tax=Pollicipes pollicipes TaxID=41117 RepID=UPI0018857BCF|nr:28S ribosomal protein S10, mitochondrial-like [Pollicipes pollicipes]